MSRGYDRLSEIEKSRHRINWAYMPEFGEPPFVGGDPWIYVHVLEGKIEWWEEHFKANGHLYTPNVPVDMKKYNQKSMDNQLAYLTGLCSR